MKFLLVLFCIFLTITSFAQRKRMNIEDRILDTILALPEVKEKAKKVETLSHNKRHLSDVIYQTPDKHFKYYWVKVWEDNGSSFTTYFDFCVNPKTKEIKFYDAINEKMLDLKSWRRMQKVSSKD